MLGHEIVGKFAAKVGGRGMKLSLRAERATIKYQTPPPNTLLFNFSLWVESFCIKNSNETFSTLNREKKKLSKHKFSSNLLCTLILFAFKPTKKINFNLSDSLFPKQICFNLCETKYSGRKGETNKQQINWNSKH